MDDDVRLQIGEEDADPERLEELTRQLRAELLQLEVDDVRRLPTGPAPEGARAFDVLAVGGLAVTLAQSAGTLLTVLGTVRDWLARAGGATRTVRLELDGDALELSSVGAAEQERLIALFVSRHQPAQP